MQEILTGILSKRQLEMIEMNTYYTQEYGNEMNDEWYYGDDVIDELVSKYEVMSRELI